MLKTNQTPVREEFTEFCDEIHECWIYVSLRLPGGYLCERMWLTLASQHPGKAEGKDGIFLLKMFSTLKCVVEVAPVCDGDDAATRTTWLTLASASRPRGGKLCAGNKRREAGCSLTAKRVRREQG